MGTEGNGFNIVLNTLVHFLLVLIVFNVARIVDRSEKKIDIKKRLRNGEVT
jgi:hypothetical protein